MNQLRLGIIGLSEGNGHPYSWSAIFNGYQSAAMCSCPFSDILQYLSKQRFPGDAIKEGRVTHVWTQDRSISRKIATACNIENVVDNYLDFINNVDAVLLARDDAELHYEMSAPFLKAGLPIYIDKPLAYHVNTAESIYSLQRYEGQIFTCSALSYAKEFHLTDEERDRIGPIKYVDACVMKSWDKYGIHIVEPVLKIIGDQGRVTKTKNVGRGERKIVVVSWESGLKAVFSNLGHIPSPIIIRLFGSRGFKEMTFGDTFFAFKKALEAFIDVVLKRQSAPSREFVLRVMRILERGVDYE